MLGFELQSYICFPQPRKLLRDREMALMALSPIIDHQSNLIWTDGSSKIPGSSFPIGI